MTSASPAMLINGVPGEQIAVADRAVQYGDGLFETLRCEAGEPRWLGRHLDRLARGCARLGLPPPPRALLGAELRQLAAGQERALAKILFTRGIAASRGYAPRGCSAPTRIVSLHPWPAPPAHWSGRFRVGLASVRLGENPALAGLKHLNRLEQVLAALEAEAQQVDEVLLAGASGDIVCGGRSNLFLIEGERLITPPLERCGVEGIVRALVLELAPQAGFAPAIETVSPARLQRAPSLFVTNVRLGLQCVHWLAGRTLAPDRRLASLQELLDVRT